MRRIDKACKDPERTSELLKLPGVKSYPGGLKITIMNNFLFVLSIIICK